MRKKGTNKLRRFEIRETNAPKTGIEKGFIYWKEEPAVVVSNTDDSCGGKYGMCR
jgi:hypothetical protein